MYATYKEGKTTCGSEILVHCDGLRKVWVLTPNVGAERPAEAGRLARETENSPGSAPGQGALPRRVRSRAKG
jgi:hypothetical protein